MRCRFHWHHFPRVPHPRTYSKAPHAPAPRQLLKHPSRRHPAFADGPSPRRHTRITKSHPESSAGSAHAPASPCHASHGMRCRFHWRPFPASRIPAPTPKHRIRQFPANFSNTLPVAAPLPRTALLRADTRASPSAILNLPQARHMPPRRLVMPATACGVAFIGVPFPRPASPNLLQSAACASSPPTSQTPSPSPPRFRGRPFSAQTHAHHQAPS